MKLFLATALICFLGCKAPELAKAVVSTTSGRFSVQVSGPLGSYKVARIDSIKSVYLIYARRNDTLFKIVSDKETPKSCANIRPGQYYKFQLRSLLFTDLTPAEQAKYPGLKSLDTHHMGGLDYDGKGLVIKLEGDSIRDLYYAKNISGLCFK
ncbi:hypothetical protein KLP40_18015 [Hymenobacter sp. NST-14]|uniref:hypothetical protein n=1 Tax=Hymenobacter piscis TaxID=2839984 RepID=UPI001C026F2B|nr:hypothetical protein [Hymenobacter piscis]MBT9395068.1 hypothetical protein [Hymenobacter piscis]